MPTQEQLMAMTTNERMWETGQLEAYKTAKKMRDVAKVRAMLESVFVDEPSIKLILSRLEGPDQ